MTRLGRFVRLVHGTVLLSWRVLPNDWWRWPPRPWPPKEYVEFRWQTLNGGPKFPKHMAWWQARRYLAWAWADRAAFADFMRWVSRTSTARNP